MEALTASKSTRRRHKIKSTRSEPESPIVSRQVSSESSNAGPSIPLSSIPTEIRIRRSFDAGDINPILNHPSVFPFVATPDMDKLDATILVANPNNVLLMVEGGGILFLMDEQNVYEVHTNFLPEYRGTYALKASLECYRWMFTHTDCMILQTRVPEFNKGAERFCRIVGANKDFERKKVWATKDGMVDVSFWSMNYQDWVRRCDALIESGRAFHKRLDGEYERHGKPPHTHEDEECHDRFVGACAETIYGGQPEKAVILYNRWARLAGYQQVQLVSRSPVVIDMGDAVIMAKDNSFTVITVRN